MSALPDASREAFEIYLHSLPHFPESPLAWTYQRDTLGNYCNNRVDDMWHGWQASRKQALEELIAHFECKPCGYEVFGQQIADEIRSLK